MKLLIENWKTFLNEQFFKGDDEAREQRGHKKNHEKSEFLPIIYKKFNGPWRRPIPYRGAELVTIYRGVPNHLENPEIRAGDWVALYRGYAGEHGTGETGSNVIISKMVPAVDVVWAGTDENEWFYVPHGTIEDAIDEE